MGSLVDLEARRPRPHSTGSAKCLSCDHEWIATAPTETQIFECPECHLWKAIRLGLHVPPGDTWACNRCCGTFFSIAPDCVMCIRCGATNPWPEPASG